ncbi:lipoate--protein ligase [Vibrio porteresiae]|uniref:lipoate--protein ligase n=1 Tax=Vibrio porteresiae DSM 19223 TaxID=1123496 RepID=A0ABZ0QK90_9VIBR|nr:lipoate--protein ligase [Vibrio porteresiae]WPC75843.1 lipoate--protein ligase [Vibrio porteresiae DSM 19223]
MKKTRILLSQSTDPWFNLAVEDIIFRSMPADQRVLFLWQNNDTVVIGRAQNPWKECKTDIMERDKVKLARRQTGGGAVFHDLGNTCFTFMAGKPEYDKSVSTQIVLDALASIGVQGKATGRNDLVVEDEQGVRKFSGSAYRETIDRGFHHGTILMSTDMSRLADYLNPDPKKLQAKGITSVKSRVINLNTIVPQIDHKMVCDAMIEAYSRYYDTEIDIEFISPEASADLPDFEMKFAKQSSWEWNFGSTPQFTHQLSERFVWGGVDLYLDVTHGVIEHAQVYSDALDPKPIELFGAALTKQTYTVDGMRQAISSVIEQAPEYQAQLEELGTWLGAQIQ